MAQLAVAWVLQNDNVAAALVGASRPEQVTENVKAAGVKIPAELMTRIDDALGDVVERDAVARPRSRLRRPASSELRRDSSGTRSASPAPGYFRPSWSAAHRCRAPRPRWPDSVAGDAVHGVRRAAGCPRRCRPTAGAAASVDDHALRWQSTVCEIGRDVGGHERDQRAALRLQLGQSVAPAAKTRSW